MAKEPPPQKVLAQLEAALERGLPPGAVLRGEESWYRARARDRLVEAARAAGLDVAQHDVGDPDFDVQGLHADLGGGSLFATRRLVVLRNGTGDGDLLRKAGSKDSPVTRSLLRALADADGGHVVVVEAPGLRADHAVAKAVKKAGGEVLSFRRLWDTPSPWNPDPRRVELVEWIVAHGRALGVRLKAEEAMVLAAATGNDLAALDREVRNVREVGTAGLAAAAERRGASKPWPVADAMCAGDLAAALPGIEGLFRGGFQEKGGRRLLDAQGLLAMLFGSARKRIHGGLAGEAARNAPERPREQWLGMAHDLAAAERRTRSGVDLDENDLFALALRWRRARGRRG